MEVSLDLPDGCFSIIPCLSWCFIFFKVLSYIHTYDLITKTGKQNSKKASKISACSVYSLKIPPTLSVGGTCEYDGITVKTALAKLRESPAGREEAKSCERPREQATW